MCLKECEAKMRAFIEDLEAQGFLPHQITTVLEVLFQEREEQEWFEPNQPIYLVSPTL